ncbi:hypothetical protein PIB30_017677 [Stylosanthes scabra]|uniref:Uncharacterized protein n=1 Tax=Stylosanthes scabra TaxID=79078 RepID=A0ABU6Z786_9FABA|nr:hypothetical protein [Stylosanthes scabra]
MNHRNGFHQLHTLRSSSSVTYSSGLPPVNIDFLHSKDDRGRDRWFPDAYASWGAGEEHVLVIPGVDDPGPSELYLRWWFMAGKRFLSEDAAHAYLRLTQLPVELRVGTRSTARDWQWLSQAMEDIEGADVPP